MSNNPVAFISHASEDKERFVIEFAKKLRAVGVDAWLDKWEMHPGDSLIDKIFEEGIKNGDFFIVILSANSVNKPWVREELNAAMVKKISKQLKIIPVVLDGVAVPECLSSTLYESIKDVNDYEESFARIKNSIFEISEKPPLGNMPHYLNSDVFTISGLTKIDSIVLFEACTLALEKETIEQSAQELFLRISKQGIEKSEFYESIDILNRKGYIKGTKTLDMLLHYYDVQYVSIRMYAQKTYKDFNEIEKKIAICIVNEQGNLQIADNLHVSNLIVNSVFDYFHLRGLIRYRIMMSGDYIIEDISPELRRMLR